MNEHQSSQEAEAPPQLPAEPEPLPTEADPALVNVTERGARPSERETRLAGRLEP